MIIVMDISDDELKAVKFDLNMVELSSKEYKNAWLGMKKKIVNAVKNEMELEHIDATMYKRSLREMV